MKNKSKQRLFLGFGIIALMLLAVFSMPIGQSKASAASLNEDLSMFRFTKVGSTHYAVALLDDEVTKAKIPDEYNGLPVAEITGSGFALSEQLEEVYIPESIKKIGNGAFYGCEKLKFANMLEVETIGQNAFAMCDELEGVVIPSSVESVGPNAFRGTSAKLYVDKLESEVNNWTNWVASFNGSIIYGSEHIAVTNILNEDKEHIGYEIRSVSINAEKALVLDYYNAEHPEDPYAYLETQGTLPVLSIYSNAFRKANLKAVAIGGNYNHPIRIESFAFAKAKIDDIYLGNNVYFADIDYDNNGNPYEIQAHSVFTGCTAKQIVLPDTMDTIHESMFMNCSMLEAIRFSDSEPNILPEFITTICDEAFAFCALEKLSIKGIDKTVGRNVFEGWADRTVKVDFVESDDAPDGWNSQWYGGAGTPAYADTLPAGYYYATFYMNVGTKWYMMVGIFQGVNGAGLPVFSSGCSYFSGWHDNVSFSGNIHTNVPSGTTENKTYYAQLTLINYTMKFFINGSLYETLEYTIFDTLYLNAPMFYSGFSGWHLGNIYGTEYSVIPQGTYGNYNFYATGVFCFPYTLNNPYINSLPSNLIVIEPPFQYPPSIMSMGMSFESIDGIETTNCEDVTNGFEVEYEDSEEDEDVLKRIDFSFFI